jgi:hypothetical protein
MELKSVIITKSPYSNDRVRIVGKISYDHAVYEDVPYHPEDYWFDVPERCAEFLSETGNPWLTCLIPLAATMDEPLRIHKPIDPLLFENTHELMLIWKRWHPHLHLVKVEAELIDAKPLQSMARTASLFSGGVDSFFTVLRHNDGGVLPNPIQIDDLICVWGFDVPLSKADEFNRMRGALQKAAFDLHKGFIDVATNLFETKWTRSGWGYLSHGSALATIGLLMEKKYSKVLIPSTNAYERLFPNGSHPLTDPLHSTNYTKIVHDGAGFDRVEKTEFISKSEVALRSLKVCWEGHSDENCQTCNKCYRTMTTLMLLGVLDRCATFNASNFQVEKIKKIYSKDENDRSLLQEVQMYALRQGRRDVARAIYSSFRRSKRITRLLRIIRRFESKRYCWRWSRALRRLLLSDSLT